jgi:hypothetical protein
MKKVLIVFIAALAGLSRLLASEAVKGFETESVVLYQSDSVLRERLLSAENLAGYIKRLQGACAEFFATADTPETLHIVVAL